jgi:hypothetical protein
MPTMLILSTVLDATGPSKVPSEIEYKIDTTYLSPHVNGVSNDECHETMWCHDSLEQGSRRTPYQTLPKKSFDIWIQIYVKGGKTGTTTPGIRCGFLSD